MPESNPPEPIAIVGSACRFPGGASSHAALAALLKEPRDVGVDIPPARFDLKTYYHSDGHHHGLTNVRQSYLLDTQELRRFDSIFFNISPNEADSMDPQQRLLLETVFEALESGGHRIEDLRGSDTAVYTGTMSVDYLDTMMRDANAAPTYTATGTNRALISNRVSYVFDWHGPSMTIDTACSSSLTAIHLAVRTLRAGESRVALGCGTQIILNPEQFILGSKLKMLSPHGRSRMWDADADGYARGEGVAAVVLKRLSDAVADGDHIQSIIRETGTNQDGHSTGITVPSSEAQTALIRDTYKRAGLDPETNADDRPQFFEAHGTGTKAGDPKEAAAIHQVFGSKMKDDAEPLYVGSIKTVIGHLEGSAGIAGVLKASAMVQHGVIYPNLLLNRLNPDVAPLYKGVEVPNQCLPWPKLENGVPRRVSINSFGFGGSNAHAIIEQWRGASSEKETPDLNRDAPQATPITFSAHSETSLLAQLRAYSAFLESNEMINIGDLAWTLQARRSELNHRISFSASSISQLKSKIDTKLHEVANKQPSNIGTKSRTGQSALKIMAIFTGQGAQWPSMGAQLVTCSEFVRGRVQELQESLAALGPDERPSWSLVEQILAQGEASQLSSAEIAQPLCTAVQIILVDLLRAAGVQFQVAVGHSSGEIAAAYASGFLSAPDAIRIAYYRGRVLQRAGKGAMMAVAMSWEEASEFTQLPALLGRVAIAAHNSPASVTLSGDVDGISEAKQMLDETNKFARLLRVDKAYHSHHMAPCGEAYVDALRSCVSSPRIRSDDSCAWFSSVKPDSSPMRDDDETLQAEYWRDNITSPVLFAEAVRNAIAHDDGIGLVLEIGPHPALKGPALQNITEIRPTEHPYSGTLSRGASDVESLSDALGFLWTHLGSQALDFQAYGRLFSSQEHKPRLETGLPAYQWDHNRIHWNESRRSRRLNSRKLAAHEVLGVLTPESTAQEMRWTNLLKQSEISWLEGHKIQDQAVFPAAGYVAMALEASKELVPSDLPIRDFELCDLSIEKAIVFDDLQDSAVETLVTLTRINKHDDGAEAFFSCYALRMDNTGSEADLERIATCTVTVSLKTSQSERMTVAPENDYRMADVDAERFYTYLAELGYNYSGPFRTVSGMRRKFHAAMGLIPRIPFIDEPSLSYVVHPSLLDMAFQLVMLALAAPGDGRLWALHLPTSVQRIRVDGQLCSMASDQNPVLLAEATTEGGSTSISSHADLVSQDRQNCWIRVENVIIKPFAPATELDDRVMFTSTKLGVAEPDAHTIAQDIKPSRAEAEAAIACERIAYFYHRKWQSEGSDADWDSISSAHLLRDWVNDTVSRASAGRHPVLQREWSDDGEQDIKALASKHWDCAEVRILTAVGENMKAAIRGETTTVEDMTAGDMLEEYNRDCIGIATHGALLAELARQISFRYPRTKFIEIGAGAGSCTEPVLSVVHDTMSSYTYTHISSLHVESAAGKLSKYGDKTAFKVLDIGEPPEPQGFQAQSYDIAIAVNFLQATTSLEDSLKHARQLLRPGGYMLLLETTQSDSIRHSTIMAGLPGGWIGSQQGRSPQPVVPIETWHAILSKSGFSGVDTETPVIDGVTWPFSILVSQAVDERIQMLRQPLSASSWSMLRTPSLRMQSLVIVGADTKATRKISGELMEHLSGLCDDITVLKGLPTDDDALELNPLSCFINLVDLESPIFKDMTSGKIRGLQNMYDCARYVLWVTEGAHVREPYHMSSIGFTRTIRREAEHIGFSHLDVEDKTDSNVARCIAENIVRLWVLGEWAHDENDAGGQQLLWSNEPEMFLEGGRLKLLRLLPQTDQNSRINALRRVVRKPLLPGPTSNIALEYDSAALLYDVVQLAFTRQNQRISADNRMIRVGCSTLMALHVATDTFLFLVSGVDAQSGDSVIGFSVTNTLHANPVVSIRLPSARDSVLAETRLRAVASQILASSIISSVTPGARILVYCASEDELFVQTLCARVANSGSHVILTTNGQDMKVKGESVTVIQLTRQMSQQGLRRVLRRAQPTHFLDMYMSDDSQQRQAGQDSNLGRCIVKNLPPGCRVLHLDAVLQRQSRQVALGNKRELTAYLENAVLRAHLETDGSQENHTATTVTSLRDIGKRNIPCHATSLVNWAADTQIEAMIHPLDMAKLFSAGKTYLLVGLSGELGQSLCEFMVAHGAGCVCLTSRRPKVDERWLSSFQHTGSKVKVLSMDVTDRVAMEEAIQDIRSSCPPIAGVAHGAMVLSDVFFSQMTTNQMTAALEPKIIGAVNLDNIFARDELDFFVLFSSVVAVAGNQGQSNYSAANAYLGSLARQRRRRGLSASVFDIGRVGGLGYFENQGQELQRQIIRTGLPPVSESDLHEAFAETILVGYSQPEDESCLPEVAVTVGIRCFTEGENVTGPWFNNAMFSHLIMDMVSTEGEYPSGTNRDPSKERLRVGKRVLEARSSEEAAEALQENFHFKLQTVLQMFDRRLDPHSPLVELGIDSLVAVEIRSWFLKELKLDIPVLKILDGASLIDVCNFALDKLSKNFDLNVDDGETSAKTTTRVNEPASSANPISSKNETDFSSLAPSTEKSDSSPRSPSPGLSSSRESVRDHEISIPGAANEILQCADKAVGQEDIIPTPTQPTLPTRKIIKQVPISFAQSGYWFLHRFADPKSSNVALCYRVAGEIRVSDLNKALRIVCARHDAFRTSFVQTDDAAVPARQCVLARSLVRLKCESISSALQASQRFHELKKLEFDLSSGELLHVLLLTLTPTCHFLILHYHHILMDGVSLQVFLSELETAYQNRPLGPPPQQYPDFSLAQRQAFEQGSLDKELQFWRGVFPDGTQPPILPLLPIAQRSMRESRSQFDKHEVFQILSPQLSEKIRLVSRSQQATPFHFYLATFRVLLFRFTEVDSLVIGMSDAARNHGSLSNSIGFFLNLLALKFEFRPNQSFVDAINEARTTSHAALKQSRLPFNVVLSALGFNRSSSHSPLFQAFIDYRLKNPRKQEWGGCQLSVEHWHTSDTTYDLAVDVTDDPDGAVVMLRAQKSLYDVAATELLLDAYICLLQAFSLDPSACVDETSLFSEKTRNLSLQVGLGPIMTSTWPETLPHRIDQIAVDYPDKVALLDDFGASLSYPAMMRRVESLCVALTTADVGEGDRVLVFQRSSIDWICSMLAIMRIGAVYVPTDTSHPPSHLSALANDCTPKAIMADSSTAGDVPRFGAPQAQHIDISTVPIGPTAPYHGGNRACPDATAAILYSSGSTGKPKGILLSHRGLRNVIEARMKTWGLGSERTLLQSAFTFDYSLDQAFVGLCGGGSVYVASDQTKKNPIPLADIIQQHDITYTIATPSVYLSWLKYGGESLRRASKWSYAFSGGEMMTNTVIKAMQHLNHDKLRLFNTYGPTEAYITACEGEINYRETLTENIPGRISCGRALPNYHICIVDDKLRQQPLGVPGELCIGGVGVGVGYLNNRELTESQYPPNPFASELEISQGWTRMYRTGDVAHMNKDGTVVVRGRMAENTQTKVRGMRVDLAYIESNMMAAADGVLQAVVVTLRKEADTEFLLAHVVFQSTQPVDERDNFLDNLLRRLSLPQFMTPLAAIPMDELPLTSHGKLDRKAIMAMALPSRNDRLDSSPPSELTETMIRLRDLWTDLIGANIVNLGSGVGPSTSFFHVGGNSLLLLGLMSQIHAKFGVALPLYQLLNMHSLREMADAVDTAATTTAIDWNNETAPPDVPSFLSDIDSSHKKGSCRAVRTIVVTGGTGFLGRHLLQVLAENPKVARVHCVAVRKRPQNGTQDLVLSDKIDYHPGDLTAPLLGLDQDTFHTLAGEADAILHLGASRSMWDGYHVLRTTNVVSTRELIKMASPRRIPIHFVSTIAASATGDPSLAEASPAPSSNGEDGYVSTKWASERLLQRAWEELNVPSMTYRFLPGPIQAAAPPSLLNEIVRFASVARVVPDAATWRGLMYLTPLATVSYMMRDAILSDTIHENAMVTHHQCDVTLPGAEILALVGSGSAQDGWEKVPILEWIGMLKRHDFSYFFGAHNASVGKGIANNR